MAVANTFQSLQPIYKESYPEPKKKRFTKLKKTVKKEK